MHQIVAGRLYMEDVERDVTGIEQAVEALSPPGRGSAAVGRRSGPQPATEQVSERASRTASPAAFSSLWRADFERALADPVDPAIASAEIAPNSAWAPITVRVTVALTVAATEVADALAIAWDAFRSAARDDLAGWESPAATAQVQPEPPLTGASGHTERPPSRPPPRSSSCHRCRPAPAGPGGR